MPVPYPDDPKFENHFTCPCGEQWFDYWSCACDDDCPKCGTTCSPDESTELE